MTRNAAAEAHTYVTEADDAQIVDRRALGASRNVEPPRTINLQLLAPGGHRA